MLQMIATTTPLGLVVSEVLSFLSQGKINKTLEAPTAPPKKRKVIWKKKNSFNATHFPVSGRSLEI